MNARVLVLLLAAAGCRPPSETTTLRLIDGKPQATRYVSPEAYEHYARAEIALSRGELQQAVAALRAALVFDPDDPHLHTTLARAHAQLSSLDEAHRALRRALALDAVYPDALLLQATLWRRQGQPAPAEQALRRSIQAHPSFAPAHLALAALLEETQRPDAARRVLERMVRVARNATEGHRRLAVLCLRQVEYACAARHMAQALQEGADLELLLHLAHIYRSTGQMPVAIRLLRETFDRSGGSLAVASVLLEVLRQAGTAQEVDDLLEILEGAARDQGQIVPDVAALALAADRPARALALVEAQQREGDTPRLRVVRAEALGKLGRNAEARALLSAELDSPAGTVAALRLAASLARERQHAQASATLRQALTRHGHDAQVVLALSRSLHAEGKIDASIQVVRAALLGRPDDRQLRFGLAMALERTGAWREALVEIRRILARHPDDAPAHNFLGYTLLERGGDRGLAERAIRKALFLQPGEGYIIDSLGWLFYRRGRLASAEELLAIAARLSPEEAEILYHLAEVHAALKRTQSAIDLLRRAISVSEDDTLTVKLRRRLSELEHGRVGSR